MDTKGKLKRLNHCSTFSQEVDFNTTNSAIKSTSGSHLAKVSVYQSSNGELGIERNISIKSHHSQGVISGTIAQTLLNSGFSTSCMEVSEALLSKDGSVILPSAFGSVLLGYQHHSTL